MKQLVALSRDSGGSAAIEMAIATPLMLLFIWGIFQVGIAFQASAGMQHALGEGARYATIYPSPTDAQIKARIAAKTFGVGVGTFADPTITNATGYKNMSVTFTMTPNFLFFNGPPIALTRSKKVYTAT